MVSPPSGKSLRNSGINNPPEPPEGVSVKSSLTSPSHFVLNINRGWTEVLHRRSYMSRGSLKPGFKVTSYRSAWGRSGGYRWLIRLGSEALVMSHVRLVSLDSIIHSICVQLPIPSHLRVEGMTNFLIDSIERDIIQEGIKLLFWDSSPEVSFQTPHSTGNPNKEISSRLGWPLSQVLNRISLFPEGEGIAIMFAHLLHYDPQVSSASVLFSDVIKYISCVVLEYTYDLRHEKLVLIVVSIIGNNSSPLSKIFCNSFFLISDSRELRYLDFIRDPRFLMTPTPLRSGSRTGFRATFP